MDSLGQYLQLGAGAELAALQHGLFVTWRLDRLNHIGRHLRRERADFFCLGCECAELKRGYTKLVYQPMLEFLFYLRDNDFTTYIVSGGGIEFVRNFSEAIHGIPPAPVVGSSIKTKYEEVDGIPTLIRLPEMHFIDDKEGKPVGINEYIGQRPIAASGNSDGDFQMLDWTASGEGRRFGLIVHHTDAEREYAYDRDSSFGHLDKALTDAPAKGWVVVDMKSDWKEIFPPTD